VAAGTRRQFRTTCLLFRQSNLQRALLAVAALWCCAMLTARPTRPPSIVLPLRPYASPFTSTMSGNLVVARTRAAAAVRRCPWTLLGTHLRTIRMLCKETRRRSWNRRHHVCSSQPRVWPAPVLLGPYVCVLQDATTSECRHKTSASRQCRLEDIPRRGLSFLLLRARRRPDDRHSAEPVDFHTPPMPRAPPRYVHDTRSERPGRSPVLPPQPPNMRRVPSSRTYADTSSSLPPQTQTQRSAMEVDSRPPPAPQRRQDLTVPVPVASQQDFYRPREDAYANRAHAEYRPSSRRRRASIEEGPVGLPRSHHSPMAERAGANESPVQRQHRDDESFDVRFSFLFRSTDVVAALMSHAYRMRTDASARSTANSRRRRNGVQAHSRARRWVSHGATAGRCTRRHRTMNSRMASDRRCIMYVSSCG
jgi:hypothetical protein